MLKKVNSHKKIRSVKYLDRKRIFAVILSIYFRRIFFREVING